MLTCRCGATPFERPHRICIRCMYVYIAGVFLGLLAFSSKVVVGSDFRDLSWRFVGACVWYTFSGIERDKREKLSTSFPFVL